jgi:hypothetical protein
MSRKKPRRTPKTGPAIARFGFRQERRPEHPSVARVEAIVSIHNRRLRRMVLLGAAARLQRLELESRRLSYCPQTVTR